MEMPPREYFDLVNELMPVNPKGAYCLGLSFLIWARTGKVPPRGTMEALAQCKTVAMGVEVARVAMEFAGPPREGA